MITYRHGDGGRALDGQAIRSAVAVPVRTGEGATSTLAVFWRETDRDPGDEDLARLEELAARAAPAIARALRALG